jgi:hypothetical protein
MDNGLQQEPCVVLQIQLRKDKPLDQCGEEDFWSYAQDEYATVEAHFMELSSVLIVVPSNNPQEPELHLGFEPGTACEPIKDGSGPELQRLARGDIARLLRKNANLGKVKMCSCPLLRFKTLGREVDTSVNTIYILNIWESDETTAEAAALIRIGISNDMATKPFCVRPILFGNPKLRTCEACGLFETQISLGQIASNGGLCSRTGTG